MRLSLKYEIYKKSWVISRRLPLKLIKFLRPKWRDRYQKMQLLSNFKLIKTIKRFKRKYLKKFRRWPKKFRNRREIESTPAFFDSVGQRKAAYFRWKKLRLNYKNQVILKNKFYSFFNNSLRKGWFKKKFKTTKLKKDVLSLFLGTIINSCFRLDYLLTSAGFFKNVFQSRPLIAEGLVQVNFKKISANYILKRGDLVSFSNGNKNLKFLDLVSSKKTSLGINSLTSISVLSQKIPLNFWKVSKNFNPILFYFKKFKFIRIRSLASCYSFIKKNFYKNHIIKITYSAQIFKYFFISHGILNKNYVTQFIQNFSAYSVNRYFFTFLEMDPYTKTTIVLKDYFDLRSLDFVHITMLSFNSTVLKKFLAFFRF